MVMGSCVMVAKQSVCQNRPFRLYRQHCTLVVTKHGAERATLLCICMLVSVFISRCSGSVCVAVA